MRSIYLRLSIHDGCNLRCLYCRPAREVKLAPRRPALDRQELVALVDAIQAEVPIAKLRLTGGEPLLRSDLPALVADLHRTLPDCELCLTTNGQRLAGQAEALRAAGLERINVSLDSADPVAYAELTRGGDLARVLAGLAAARRAGFRPLKLNAVLLRSQGTAQLERLVRLAAGRVEELRFIELMPISVAAGLHRTEFWEAAEAAEALARAFGPLEPLSSSATAERHRLHVEGQPLVIGFIPSVSRPFCERCDRLRLDCRGRLFACLRHPDWLDLAGPLANGDRTELRSRVRRVIAAKGTPESIWPGRQMSAIGG